MHFGFFKQFAKISLLSVAGGATFYQISGGSRGFKIVYNSFTPTTTWDSNWDHRAPRVLKENSAALQENEVNSKIENNTPKAIRNILLIRHGQYIYKDTDKERKLTELGRGQATFTGKRLSELAIPIDSVVVSTMTRAQETANLILKQLPKGASIKRDDCKMLEEGAVMKPIPEIDYWNPDDFEFFVDNARIEAAFRRYIHRADPSQQDDSHTMLVCHGNVIRYFVCRALQLPPEAWLRFNIHHASITWLVLYPNGRVVVRFFGDAGHMPQSHVTLS